MDLVFICIGVVTLGLVGAQDAVPSTPCTLAARTAVEQCFTAEGFPLKTVMALLQNGTGAALPPNADQARQSLCSKQASVIQCVFGSVNNLRADRCSNNQEYAVVERDTVNLLGGLQRMCGGPGSDQCIQDMTGKMQDCYVKAGLNPTLFSPNGTNVQGAILGDSVETADKFCSARQKLFTCMNEVTDNCPGAKEMMSVGGFDQDAMAQGVNVLCGNIQVYLTGLLCFQKPDDVVRGCLQNMTTRMSDLLAAQLQQSMPIDAFFQNYCQIRLDHLMCDTNAWKSVCDAGEVGLKTEFECTTVPSHCKKNPNMQTILGQACSEEKFMRDRRKDRGKTGEVTGNGNSVGPSASSSWMASGLSTVIVMMTILMV